MSHVSNPAVTIIGIDSGRGARDTGCADGPRALRQFGTLDRLRRINSDIRWLELAPLPVSDAVQVVADVTTREAGLVRQALANRRHPIIVGGDHSCAIGSWGAFHGRFRLLWIDAHMDMHTPSTSPSQALHGMPLACLMGYGDPRLLARGPSPLNPADVTLLGVRSFEPEEAQLARELGVRVHPAGQLAGAALGAAITAAIGPEGPFGISLDLDGIDPAFAPGVGTPEPGGLDAGDLLAALIPLVASPRCLGLEIAEYNPSHDLDHKTARLVEALLEAAVTKGEPS